MKMTAKLDYNNLKFTDDLSKIIRLSVRNSADFVVGEVIDYDPVNDMITIECPDGIIDEEVFNNHTIGISSRKTL